MRPGPPVRPWRKQRWRQGVGKRLSYGLGKAPAPSRRLPRFRRQAAAQVFLRDATIGRLLSTILSVDSGHCITLALGLVLDVWIREVRSFFRHVAGLAASALPAGVVDSQLVSLLRDGQPPGSITLAPGFLNGCGVLARWGVWRCFSVRPSGVTLSSGVPLPARNHRQSGKKDGALERCTVAAVTKQMGSCVRRCCSCRISESLRS